MINLADLVSPKDLRRRTYREINNATPHAFEIGALVELENGARLFVVEHTRDCDGTPLYTLSPLLIGQQVQLRGFLESSLTPCAA